MMIAVEGMDGVGKTEISKYICEQYGFTFIMMVQKKLMRT